MQTNECALRLLIFENTHSVISTCTLYPVIGHTESLNRHSFTVGKALAL